MNIVSSDMKGGRERTTCQSGRGVRNVAIVRGGLGGKSGGGGGGKRLHLKIFRKEKPPWLIWF